MLNLLIKTPFEDISKAIAHLREKRGSEKQTLSWIEEAINFGHGFITNLYFERILVYQHLIMREDVKPTEERDHFKRREALAKMEAATLAAQKYVQLRKLKEWESRVYRFLGRLYDYKNQFAKAIVAYKKGVLLAKYDPEFVEKGAIIQLCANLFYHKLLMC